MRSAVRIATRLGLDLAGIHDSDGDGERPAVLLLHGFTGWKEEAHIESLATALNRVGIAALRIDAPGSGESGGTFTEHYRLSNSIDSVNDALDWLRAQPGINPDHIGIWGHSMGGFAAIAAAVRRPDRIQAVCGCQASIGKFRGVTTDIEAWRRTGWAAFPSPRFRDLQLPYDFYLDTEPYDVFEELGKLRAPLQLIAGTRDDIITADHVRKMFSKANEPKELHEFNVDHFFKKSARQRDEINAVTVAFFQKFLDSSD
jgi:pimeloyl-ACP methyl ester carboxylesterase